MQTEDGLEQTLATNFFSGALLALSLVDQMKSPGSRIIFMASQAEWPLSKVEPTFHNIRGNELKRSGLTAYGSSKAYEIMFARELASRLKHRGIDVFAVQPGVVWTPVHAKMDRSHYLAAWAVSGSGLFFGQTQYHGAWSTLYAATEPSLSGKGFGYFGPNMLGLWHATERQPGTKQARNPVTCWRLFEETVKVLEEIVGSAAMPPVPGNPDDSQGAAPLKGNYRSAHKPTATAA
ncbi:uncharacterized protein HaLaN_00223 [Haematococcus lacustris]|uniref:WW domain-containing oxidoreductase n=1 Tax=Haematococcus lacustris TaxID=44745 RepID=A0A699YIE7_HAELA|nr:uncharacterized protein HaLaN_00223 [Haematococcus lacustris]